ncbi:MAG: hypothetical protein PVF66_05475 [Candidatus Aminicenantes bacterium]|jgi:hypothetical protein
MKIFDFLEEVEGKLIDELYEDPISKSLTEFEKSIEDSIIQPDSFEPPVLYQPDSLVLGEYDSNLKNEFNLGGEERSGTYEVPIPPLRMSGGSRKPFQKRLSGVPLRGRNHQLKKSPGAIGERCPLRNDNPVTFECLHCIHSLTFYEYSHCGIKEEEFLDNLETSEEE